MRNIKTLVLLILLLEPNSAQAFFGKKKAKKEAPKALVNEEVLIHGKYRDNQDETVLSKILELRLAIHIPRDQDSLTITTLYDEASENPIEKITWLREGEKGEAITAYPFKTESIINKKLEEMSISYNPSLAYDRISENKHVINKIFYFKQAEAIGDRAKPIAHFLDLHMPGDHGPSQKRIRIDDKLYYQEPQVAFIPQAPKKKEKSKAEKAAELRQVKLMQEKQAQLEAQQQQEMINVQSALKELNGTSNQYEVPNMDPEQFKQIQQQQQLDIFANPDEGGGDFEEDIY